MMNKRKVTRCHCSSQEPKKEGRVVASNCVVVGFVVDWRLLLFGCGSCRLAFCKTGWVVGKYKEENIHTHLFLHLHILTIYIYRTPRGQNAARKLKNHRRQQRWHDKLYAKKHSPYALKANPFQGASHAKGIVLERIGIEAKQPNSAIRKCVRVQLVKNGKKIAAFVPGDGCLNYIEENVCMVFESICYLC